MPPSRLCVAPATTNQFDLSSVTSYNAQGRANTDPSSSTAADRPPHGTPPTTASTPGAPPSANSSPSREHSVTRGRGVSASNAALRSLQVKVQHAVRASSPRSGTPVNGAGKQTSAAEQASESRNFPLAHDHNRQGSLFNGKPRSRRPSFANALSPGPLSPLSLTSVRTASTTQTELPPHSSRDYLFDTPMTVGLNGGTSDNEARQGYSSKAARDMSAGDYFNRRPSQKRMDNSNVAGTKPDQADPPLPDNHGSEMRRTDSQQPRTQQPELNTVGEYALHHLFNAFVVQADEKINRCITGSTELGARVKSICGPGVDPAFDQLISALGHIARQKPKQLIDSLMLWRKVKSEAAANARARLNQARSPVSSMNGFHVQPRRRTEQQSVTAEPEYTGFFKGADAGMNALQDEVYQAESRTPVSIYILCRVLMEIIGQSTLASITPEVAVKLEDNIYNQLRTADKETLDESPMKLVNWMIFARLLGVMSTINFESVVVRFVVDLREAQKSLAVKGTPNKDVESKAVLIIRGMRYLQLRTDSQNAWDRTSAFVLTLSKFFANVHGQPAKYAYCQLFEHLLLPVTTTPLSLLSRPSWKEAVDILKPRLSQMLVKPKHWGSAFPLMAILLSVSPREYFLNQWQPMVLNLQPKLRERATRGTAMRAICRLVWTYLYKISEPQHAMIRKIEEVIKLIFQSGRRSQISTEPSVAEPLIQLVRIIGVKFQDLCFRSIIFPLLNAEMFAAGREHIKAENLEPERMVIGIRAFLAVVGDLEKGTQPPFPITFHSDLLPDLHPSSPAVTSPTASSSVLKTSLVKEERLSRPVLTASFSDVTKQAYARFCQILGEITIICDETFGGQATLDEKFASPIPKTPITEAFSFTRREDHLVQGDARQGFYDLLHVAVQALPRCLSPQIPFNHLINLLCTGTAHVQSHIAVSSAQSLKSIARQSHAQQVTIGFARFIFNFDDRYSTVSDGGLLGSGHIESTLKLYVELLQIWIEEIKQRTREGSLAPDENVPSTVRSALQSSETWGHVNEVESHGLFFLCSPSRRVRAFAINVLRLVVEFDTALGKEATRIIRIMEGSSQNVLHVDDESLSVAERSRLQRGMRNSSLEGTLVELSSSDVPYDSTLWFKIFPNLIRISFEVCPLAVAVTRDIACARLSQVHKNIVSLAEGTRISPGAVFDFVPLRGANRLPLTPPEKTIGQWKLHLIFACTTLTNTGTQQPVLTQNAAHTRKSSKSSQQSQEKIHSGAELFSKVIPLLSAGNPAIRSAIVAGMGSINVNLFKTMLESLQTAVMTCYDEAKLRFGSHQRSISSPRRNQRTDYLRTEITHIYKLTSHFLRDPTIYTDDWILAYMVQYTTDIRIFLMDAEVQNEWDYQQLRIHYCGLLEEVFESVNRTKDPIRWMPFQSRKAAFALMEEWCGHSPNQRLIRQREDLMKRSYLNRENELGVKSKGTANIEIEIKALRLAALSAMAALCAGPIQITTESKVHMKFDLRLMLDWLDTIFDTESDRIHAIGRKALKNLIIHNKGFIFLLEWSIEKCFAAKSPKALESCFEVITQILIEHEDHQLPFWKVLGAGLYALGNESSKIRMKSARLLRTMEERQQKQSKLQDLDISISDRTTAVYKQAQFEMSCKLADHHSELAFHVFSEFSRHFRALQPDHQRNMVGAMLPWLQKIELQLDVLGRPTATTYMLLVNLFEITIVCSSTALHNEVLGLWKAVASGPYGGNVKVVLDFIKNLCLEKREQNVVDYAKQIVVFLSGTPAGIKVIDALLLEITPKAMIPQERPPAPVPPEVKSLPYLADLSQALLKGNKQTGLSMGQLCLILLVDLVVRGVKLDSEHVPTLLQVVLALWDHYTPLVKDQVREMLVHLLHELIISKIDDDSTNSDKKFVEDFIESIRRQDPTVVWAYEDMGDGPDQEDDSIRVPESMLYVANQTIRCFEVVYPRIREAWAKVSLNWATSCPVRHQACRSFEIFRCIFVALDQTMLADMLARLSNVIADSNSDTQSFSMEVITTLRTIIGAFDKTDLLHYVQFFWTTCACLSTSCEREYLESLLMLEALLNKLDLSDPAVVRLLEEAQPPGWQGSFDGLQALIDNGIRSSICIDRSLNILEKLALLPSGPLVGHDDRILSTVLANLPRFMRYLDEGSILEQPYRTTASVLADVAETQGLTQLSKSLNGFAAQRFKSKDEFVSSVLAAIRLSFFPRLELEALTFMMGLLTNKLRWVKIYTMQLLCHVIPDINMRKHEIASKGADLISPLLRLLQTNLCNQALEVLDRVMDMSGTPMDNHFLRMSMAGSDSTRALRKEYERTKSLYGIPEDSGWSIPMPAIQATVTRANVHAVWRTCAISGAPLTEDAATPDLEFTEEQPFFGPYPLDRTATRTSESDRGEANMGELAQKLNSLDDFFDESFTDDLTSEHTSLHSKPSLPQLPTASTLSGIREEVYDQQTFPILHKSLTRNASVSSLQAGFADPTYHHHRRITPRSNNNPVPDLSPAPTPRHKRPAMQSRSVSTPSSRLANGRRARAVTLAAETLAESETEPALLSDGEYDGGLGRTRSLEKGTSFDGVRPTPLLRASGLRNGFRRFMGGGGGGAVAPAGGGDGYYGDGGGGVGGRVGGGGAGGGGWRDDGGAGEPKVPRVPSVYLKNLRIGDADKVPRSADL